MGLERAFALASAIRVSLLEVEKTRLRQTTRALALIP